MTRQDQRRWYGTHLARIQRLLRASGQIPSGALRPTAEALEARTYLAGFDPAGLGVIGTENVPAPRTLGGADISVFDITGTNASQFDRVTFSSQVTLGGLVRPNFPTNYTLQAGDRFRLLDGSGGGSLQGAFAGIAKWDAPTSSSLNFIAIQGPDRFELVATDLPTGNLTIATTSAAEAESLAVMFAGGRTGPNTSVTITNGAIHSLEHRIEGRLTLTRAANSSDLTVTLADRDATPAGRARLVSTSDGNTLITVFGTGSFNFNPDDAATDPGLRSSSSAPFTAAAYAVAPATAPTGPGASLQIGPITFTSAQPHFNRFTLIGDSLDVDFGVSSAAGTLDIVPGASSNPSGVSLDIENISGGARVVRLFNQTTPSLPAIGTTLRFEADKLSAAFNNYIRISAEQVQLTWDRLGPASQQVLAVDAALVEVPDLKMKFDIARAPSNPAPGEYIPPTIRLYGNGFELGDARFTLNTSTFGSTNNETLGYYTIGNNFRIADPFVGVSNFGVRYDALGIATVTPGAAFSVGAREVRFGEPSDPSEPDSGSLISLWAANPNITIGLTNGVPSSFEMELEAAEFQIRRYLTIEVNNIVVNTQPDLSDVDTTNDYYFTAGLISGELSLSKMLQRGDAQSTTSFTIGAEIANFGIRADGKFIPGAHDPNEDFRISGTLGFSKFTELVEKSESTNSDDDKVGDQLPTQNPGGGGFNVTFDVYWEDLTNNPEQFVLVLREFAIEGMVGDLELSGSVTDLVFDSKRIRRGEFPIVYVGEITGTVGGQIGGTTFSGELVAGSIALNAANEPLTLQQVIDNTSSVARATWYFGGTADFEFANNSGFAVRFAFSTKGFIQAYLRISLPTGILLEPNSGLTINDFSGGITFGAPTLPTPRDPAQLDSAVFKPTLALSFDEWREQVRRIALAQSGGSGGYIGTIDDDDDDTNDLNTLNNGEVEGTAIPDELQDFFVNNGFPISGTTKRGSVKVLQADDSWLLSDRSGQFLISRRVGNQFDVFYLGNAAFSDTQATGYGNLPSGTNTATPGQVTAVVPGNDLEGNAYPQTLLGLFQSQQISVPTSALVKETIASERWSIEGEGVKYTIRRIGLSDGEVVYVISGGDTAAFGTDAADNIRVEAGFTLYSQYISRNVVEFRVDAIIDSSGKFLITGEMLFGSVNTAPSGDGARSEGVATAKIKVQQFFDLSEVQNFSLTMLTLMQIEAPVPNDDPMAPVEFETVFTVHVALTFGFYKNGANPGDDPIRIDGDYLTAAGVGSIAELLTDGDTSNDFDFYQIDLKGSERLGVAAYRISDLQQLVLGLPDPDSPQLGAGSAQLRFSNDRLEFRFELGLSATGLIEANSFIAAAGVFVLEFETGASFRLRSLHGVAALRATTEDFVPLNVAGVRGQFNALLKLNIGSEERLVELQLPGQTSPNDYDLRPFSFGLYAQTNLVFEPPVVGGSVRQKIFGLFGLELSRDGGIRMLVMGEAPVPLPIVSQVAPPLLKADVLGLFIFTPLPAGSSAAFGMAGRLEMALRDNLPPEFRQYFTFQAQFQFFLNTSGQRLTFTLPEDFVRSFASTPGTTTPTIPANLRARLDPDNDGLIQDVSVAVPAGAPQIGWRPGMYNEDGTPVLNPDGTPVRLDGPQDAAGAYLVIMASGTLAINAGGGGSAPGLLIDASELTGGGLRIAFKPTQFDFSIGGRIEIRPLGTLVVNGTLTIVNTGTLLEPDFDVWGSLQLGTSFQLDELKFAAALSIDLNTSSSPQTIKRYYDRTNRVVLATPVDEQLPGDTLQVFAGGQLKWNDTTLLLAEFQFTASPDGLAMAVTGVMALDPLANVAVTGSLLLNFDGTAVGYIDVTADINLSPLTFSGQAQVLFNTSGAAQTLMLLPDGNDQTPDFKVVEGGAFMVYVRGDLSFGVFRLGGHFTFLNNSQKLSISGAAALDLYVAQVNVDVAAEIYKSSAPGGAGLVLDVGIDFNVNFFSFFRINANGRLQLSTRAVATLTPAGNSVPPRQSSSVPYLNINATASVNLLNLINLSGSFNMTTITDTEWQQGWSAPKRNWRIAGSFMGSIFGLVNINFGQPGDPVVFYDSGEFTFNAGLYLQLGPNEFHIYGNARVNASFLRGNNGDATTLTSRDLNLSGNGALGVGINIDLGEIDFGLLGTLDLGSINETFDLVSGSFNYNGANGEFTVTVSVIGFSRTFTIGFLSVQEPPPVNLAGPAVSAYTQDSNGYWHANWTGGLLNLNTGSTTDGVNRARLRNTNNTITDESYTLEGVGEPVNGRQRIKVSAFGLSVEYADVTEIVGLLGDGNDTIFIRSSVKVPVRIEGGGGNDKITYEGTNTAILLGGEGNDRITAAGGAGSRAEGQGGDDVITWLAGAGPAISILGGDGFDQFLAVTRARITGPTGNVLSSGDDIVRLWRPAGEQFRVSLLNSSDQEIEYIAATSGFESLRINTLSGSDRVVISDFAAAGLQLYIDLSRYQTGVVTETTSNGSTRTSPAFGNDSQADAITLLGGAAVDVFTITSATDTSDLDGDTNTSEINLIAVRSGQYSLNVLNLVVGSEGGLRVDGLGGDDTIHLGGLTTALFSAHTIIGGGANDTLTGSPFADTIWGDNEDGSGTGNDTIRAGGGGDRVHAGNGNNFLYGEQGDDQLTAGSGNDTLDGGEGADALDGGLGDDIYTGGLGVDTYADAGGRDTLVEARNTDLLITDDTFVVGVLTAAAATTSGDQFASASEYENLRSIFEIARITGGDGENTLVVGDVDGKIRLGSNWVSTRHTWSGLIDLIGGSGGDRYIVTIFGRGDAVINVIEQARSSTGTDSLRVYGSNNSTRGEVFLLRPSFIAALGAIVDGRTLNADRVNFTTAIEGGATVLGLLGDDQFIVDDNAIPTTIEGGGGRDFIQVGQLFGAVRNTPYVAPGDRFETTLVDLSPAGSQTGSIIGYLSNGASHPLTVNGGEGNDRMVVFRNLATLTLNGDAGDDSFSVRAFALVGPSANTAIAGGGGADAIEYAENANVDINGGDGLDSIRILGTQFGDTFTITELGINGAGLNVRFTAVESLELHAGDGNDTIYILATPAGVRVAIFGGAGSDRFYITGTSPATGDTRADDLTRIDGPVLIEGGPGGAEVFGLTIPVLMTGERDLRLPPGAGSMFGDEQPGDVDTLDVIATAETRDLAGLHAANIWPDGDSGLAVHTLSGLGLGGPLTQGDVTTPGGISYRSLEIVDIQLGSGAETLAISSVAAGATTVFRGNGGADHFTITAAVASNAFVVVFGDNAASLTHSGATADDVLDASGAVQAVTLYGGAGNDTLLGGSGRDRIFGGSGLDVLGGGSGDDLIMGDTGIDFDRTTRLTTLRTSGGAGLDNFNTVGADTINPGDGVDVVLGDHGRVTQQGGVTDILDPTAAWAIVETTRPDLGAADTISARRDAHPAFTSFPLISTGSDLAFGGLGSDLIIGGLGDDTLVGDHGRAAFVSGALSRVESTDPTLGDGESISGGDGHDRIIAGAGSDNVDGGSGDDLIFGDHGQFDLTLPANANYLALFTARTHAGAADTIYAGSGHDIALGQQGDDTLYGQEGDDDLIGGHNVAGGIDELEDSASGNDRMDGGEGHDVIAADNAIIIRIAGGGARFRQLSGSTIYQSNGTLLIGDTHQADPRGVLIRTVTLLDHDTASHAAGGVFGHDVIAGGAGDDMIFGQLGDDQLRGDGSLSSGGGSFSLIASATADGDDYIEGNGGNDAIWGDLGRDDLIGGSSSLFGLTLAAQRLDGADTIFGGDGSRITRNHTGDTSATGHAADSDFILGDNGNVFRLVGAGGQSLTFAYDNYSTSLRLVPRGVQFLDYSAANTAPSTGDADVIRGEAGDDTIHGMTGNDTLYGDAQDDDITGGLGDDWIYGGTGQDGILGDDGLIATARNGAAEAIHGIGSAPTETISAASVISTTIFNAGQLQKYATLPTFHTGGNDVIYAGLGDDFAHGGEGMDAISGAEALNEFYNLTGARPSLVYSTSLRRFLAFDPGTGLRKIAGFFLNFEASISNVRVDDGRDALFGDHGHDWLVGGTNQDRIFGGMGDDVLNGDDNLDTNSGLNFSADSGVYAEADIAFGGGGLDRLIANTTSDRLIDWVDDFNQYLSPFTGGYPNKITNPTAPIITALRSLGRGSGADQLLIEPNGELGLVQTSDPEWSDQIGRPLTLTSGPIVLTGDWDVSRRTTIKPRLLIPTLSQSADDVVTFRFDG